MDPMKVPARNAQGNPQRNENHFNPTVIAALDEVVAQLTKDQERATTDKPSHRQYRQEHLERLEKLYGQIYLPGGSTLQSKTCPSGLLQLLVAEDRGDGVLARYDYHASWHHIGDTFDCGHYVALRYYPERDVVLKLNDGAVEV